jgi:hypothetical protein
MLHLYVAYTLIGLITYFILALIPVSFVVLGYETYCFIEKKLDPGTMSWIDVLITTMASQLMLYLTAGNPNSAIICVGMIVVPHSFYYVLYASGRSSKVVDAIKAVHYGIQLTLVAGFGFVWAHNKLSS